MQAPTDGRTPFVQAGPLKSYQAHAEEEEENAERQNSLLFRAAYGQTHSFSDDKPNGLIPQGRSRVKCRTPPDHFLFHPAGHLRAIFLISRQTLSDSAATYTNTHGENGTECIFPSSVWGKKEEEKKNKKKKKREKEKKRERKKVSSSTFCSA